MQYHVKNQDEDLIISEYELLTCDFIYDAHPYDIVDICSLSVGDTCVLDNGCFIIKRIE